jgi:pimeloyl-ACP methyl ester carboxylesterase
MIKSGVDTSLPVVMVPGLLCSARLYHHQIAELWQYGPVQVAHHTRGSAMAQIAHAILFDAPPRFALVGLSMGGYIIKALTAAGPNAIPRSMPLAAPVTTATFFSSCRSINVPLR